MTQLPKKLTQNEKRFLKNLIEYSKTRKPGIPLCRSKKDVAIIYRLHELGMSYNQIGKLVNASKKAIYELFKAIEKGKITIYDPKTREFKKVSITIEEIKQLIDEIKKSRKLDISDISESEIIQEFIRKPVKIRGEGFYSIDQVNDTLNTIKKLVKWIKEHKELKKTFEGYSTNPDYWVSPEGKEFIENVVYMYCKEIDPAEGYKFKQCKYRIFGSLRRVKAFYDAKIGEGKMGAVSKTVQPRTEYELLTLEDYRKFLQYCKEAKNPKEIALCDIIILHITTGAREYGNLKKIVNDRRLGDYPISSDYLASSLLGIKWENIIFNGNGVKIVNIFESKTKRYWNMYYCDLFMPKWYIEKLKKYYEYAKEKGISKVVETILKYHKLDKYTEKANYFALFYQKGVKRIGKKLFGKELVPHDIRASHISILAEYKIPLEIAVSPRTGFGVGWEDLKTAVEFYLRFSEQLVKEYYMRAKEISEKALSL